MKEWTCSSCQAVVDEGFDVCWNCGTSQDGTPDAEFRSADYLGPAEAERPSPASSTTAREDEAQLINRQRSVTAWALMLSGAAIALLLVLASASWGWNSGYPSTHPENEGCACFDGCNCGTAEECKKTPGCFKAARPGNQYCQCFDGCQCGTVEECRKACNSTTIQDGAATADQSGDKPLGPKPLLKIGIPIQRVVLDEAGDIIELAIVGDECKDEHLRSLAGLKQLRRLDLRRTGITDEGIKHLAQLKSLEHLNLARTKIRGAGLEHLKDVSLKSLVLDDSWVTEHGFLKYQISLESLSVAGGDGNDPLPRLPQLRELNAAKAKVDWLVKSVRRLSSLEQLNFNESEGYFEEDDIKALSSVKTLKTLNIRGATALDSAVFFGLSELSELRVLDIGGFSHVTNEFLAAIKSMPKLEELRVDDSAYVSENTTGVDDAGMGHLAEMTQLKSLDIGNNRITSDGIAKLTTLNQLRELDIRGTVIDDQGMKHVAKLSGLRVLTLGKQWHFSNKEPIGTDGLLYLAPLKNLEALNIPNIAASRQGLRYLDRIPSLKLVVGPLGSYFADPSRKKRIVAPFDPKQTLALQQAGATKAEVEVDITNSIGMKLKFIPAGQFVRAYRSFDSQDVTLSKPFYLGTHEVTQEQYEKIMGTNPSKIQSAKHPVERVSWNDAIEFCRKLSEKEGRKYRLPTEAEWEYACRAGTETIFSFGDPKSQLSKYAWFSENSNRSTHPIGQKLPNPWGLYDMHGNVQEWCQDWGAPYPVGPHIDPVGPDGGESRIHRGGSRGHNADRCTSSFRGGWGQRLGPKVRGDPSSRDMFTGFRVATDLPRQ